VTVSLTGTNLGGAIAVSFGGTPAISFGCTSTSCLAVAPTLAPGTSVVVTVTTAGGTSNGLTFVYVAPSGATGATGASGGFPVAWTSGWTIVGGPTGTLVTGALGPLYTFQAGDTVYEIIPSGSALTQPQGYWAFFNAAVAGTVPLSGPQTLTVALPPSQWVMIGNPGNSPATVTGADVVYTYTVTSGYQATTTLQPGQGAWAISVAGGTATIANS
jgi:hypothetical protein